MMLVMEARRSRNGCRSETCVWVAVSARKGCVRVGGRSGGESPRGHAVSVSDDSAGSVVRLCDVQVRDER